MSEIHTAVLSPTKPEAIARHLSRRWQGASFAPKSIQRIAAYRFDDPAGEVGCETHIVVAEAVGAMQVPLTYRGAPLEGAPAEALIMTMQHSVLGDRWVYDAAYDPVYASELISVIAEGGAAAPQFRILEDGSQQPISEGLAAVRGTGAGGDGVVRTDSTVEAAGAGEADDSADVSGDLPAVERTETSTIIRFQGTSVEVRERLAGPTSAGGESGQLVATWDGQDEPVLLAQLLG